MSSIFNKVLVALAILNQAGAATDLWGAWAVDGGELGHECRDAVPCEDSTFYFNELACECFKIETCDWLKCHHDLLRDPREDCACTDKPPVYPDWATEEHKREYAAQGIARAA